MSLDLDYITTLHVMDSWEAVRRTPNYEEVAGTILFTHLFDKCPPTKVLFGFPLTMDVKSDIIRSSKRFLRHSKFMIQMLDKALDLVGPNSEFLAEILSDLGKTHARMGVKADFFPIMGDALLETLREMQSTSFTPEIEHAWTVVYNGLSTEMIKSMNADKVVVASWKQLQQIENYQDVAGSILFQRLFQKCPETKAVFGFSLHMDHDSPIVLGCRRFRTHSSYFIEMLDKTLEMVESKEIETNMTQLGATHAGFGVKPEYFPVMVEALLHTLETVLGESEWNEETKSAWKVVFGRLSAQLIAAMKKQARCNSTDLTFNRSRTI